MVLFSIALHLAQQHYLKIQKTRLLLPACTPSKPARSITRAHPKNNLGAGRSFEAFLRLETVHRLLPKLSLENYNALVFNDFQVR